MNHSGYKRCEMLEMFAIKMNLRKNSWAMSQTSETNKLVSSKGSVICHTMDWHAAKVQNNNSVMGWRVRLSALRHCSEPSLVMPEPQWCVGWEHRTAEESTPEGHIQSTICEVQCSAVYVKYKCAGRVQEWQSGSGPDLFGRDSEAKNQSEQQE